MNGDIENQTEEAGGEGGVWTAEQIRDLEARAAKADENWEKFLRQAAEIENYKKRAAREKTDAIKFANEGLLEKIVPILDNFEMALAATASEASAQSLQTGVSMIYNQLKSVVTEAGLEGIEAAGRPFDPNLHEAVSQQETTEVPDGQVLQQLRRGYKLRERLVRPATVVVAKNRAS